MEFWRDFKVFLNTNKKVHTHFILDLEGVLSRTEISFVKKEGFGENATDVMLYLLKMNTKYSPNIRAQFKHKLVRSNSFKELQKKWNKLSKSNHSSIPIKIMKYMCFK